MPVSTCITLSNLGSTKDLASIFPKFLKKGDVIALWGDLGSGKTTFSRFLIQACGYPKDLEVPSPTFTLVQIYDLPTLSIWHFDLYRIKHEDEIFNLGLEEALSYGVTLIEWPMRLEKYLPKQRLDLFFSIDPDTNSHCLEGKGSDIWHERWDRILNIHSLRNS